MSWCGILVERVLSASGRREPIDLLEPDQDDPREKAQQDHSERVVQAGGV